jgi:uncharacterized protein YqkB
MKQLLSLFLFLLPCLAWAQYPSNGNQKITLGEQTTADGLIFRGVASIDTVTATSKITRANKQDTSAFLLLDTVTNLLWHYKTASNGWSQAGGSTFDTTTLNLVSRFAAKLNISDTASMLTNYYRSGRTGIIQASDVPTLNQNTTGSAATLTTSRTFQTNLASTSTASFNGSANVTPGVTGTLPVANGGTGASSLSPNNYLIRTNSSGIFDTSAVYEAGGNVGIGTTSPEANDWNPLARIAHIYQNTANGAIFKAESSNTKTLLVAGNGIAYLATTTNSPFAFYTNTTEQMRITSGGNVGIGTTSPPYALSVVRSTDDWIGTYKNYGSGAFGLQIDLSGSTGSTNGFVIGAYSQTGTGFFLKNDGNVGIGTTSPASKLNIMGTVRINSASAPDANYYLQLENSSSQKAKANAWDTYSDSRIKTNRQPIINAIDKINLLNPTYYNQHDSYVEDDLLNIDYNNSYKSLGFIAQEVYEVIPEAVNMGTTNELWAMDYTKLIPILTKAIQEQQALIKALEQRIINLENK